MNIILIGFMGVGKTAVGQRLAESLGYKYIDCDELIEKTEKMAIVDIFAQKGEDHFRNLETEVLQTLGDYDNFVISTGGGMVLRQENVKILKAIGPLILLWAEPDVIYERIKKEAHRPLLKVADPLAEISKILTKRKPIYEQIADKKIDTSDKTIDEVVVDLKRFIKEGKYL